MPSKKCPFCIDGRMTQQVKEESLSYKGHSISVEQPGLYCDTCDEAIFSGKDLRVTQKAVHDLHAQVDGYLTSDEVKNIRVKLGLSQKKAAELFGGGVNAFSRYERGEARQSKSTDTLLRLLCADSSLIKFLNTVNARGVVSCEPNETWLSVSRAKASGTTSQLNIGKDDRIEPSLCEVTFLGRTVGDSNWKDNKKVVNG